MRLKGENEMKLCMGCMEQIDDQLKVCPYCGYIEVAGVEEAYYLVPGTMLQGRYMLGKVLGYGGFGITYIGYDRTLQKKVAVKEFFPSDYATRRFGAKEILVYSGDAYEQFQIGLNSFINEARRLAIFINFAEIVDIFDCFKENGTGYIVMEYLKGHTVKELLKERKMMPYVEAESIILHVLDGLQIVHKAGIIHRDIAPDNIFITYDGTVKLLDFGASRSAISVYSKSLSVILKPGYAPEEQYRTHGEQGPWTDVYGTGATFYRMLTGICPLEALERMVEDDLKKPSELGVKISPEKEKILLKSLEVRKENRFQNANEFKEALLSAENAGDKENKIGREQPWHTYIENPKEEVKKLNSYIRRTLMICGVVGAGFVTMYLVRNNTIESNENRTASGNMESTALLGLETEEKTETEMVVELPVEIEKRMKLQLDNERQSETEVIAKSGRRSEAKSVAESEKQSEAESTAESERQSEAESAAESERQSEAESVAESEKQSEAESTTESERQSEAESAAESERQSESESVAESERQSEAESAAESERQSEAESTAESKRESEAESTAESERQSEAEPAAESEEQSEVEFTAESEKQFREEQKTYRAVITAGKESWKIAIHNDTDRALKSIQIRESATDPENIVFDGDNIDSNTNIQFAVEEGKMYDIQLKEAAEGEILIYYGLDLTVIKAIWLREEEGYAYAVYREKESNRKVDMRPYAVKTFADEQIRYSLTGLNVRRSPDTVNGDVIMQLNLGSEVHVIGEAKGVINGNVTEWFMIRTENGYGYISAKSDYTTEDKAIIDEKLEAQQRAAEQAAQAAQSWTPQYSGGGSSGGGGNSGNGGRGNVIITDIGNF